MNYALVLAVSNEAILEFRTAKEAIDFHERFEDGAWKEVFPHLSKAPETYVGSWDSVKGWVRLR